jgi:phosphatidylserine decarboxylase
MFTKYGYSTLIYITILSFLIIALSLFIKQDWLKYLIIILSGGFFLFTLFFFRDPERKSPSVKDAIISPADGKILLIKDVASNEFVTGDAIQISVFMSPFDVHVNRIPIDGKVKFLKYIHGKFLTAYNDKADKENERNEIGIESKYGPVFFTQVSGVFARRIISTLKLNDDVVAGKRFGMIKFGSRSDIIVPKDKWEPQVKVGQHVTAGKTIIYKIKNEK